jgi:hypothetical protein
MIKSLSMNKTGSWLDSNTINKCVILHRIQSLLSVSLIIMNQKTRKIIVLIVVKNLEFTEYIKISLASLFMSTLFSKLSKEWMQYMHMK